MYIACRDYLVNLLKQSVTKGKVYISQKELDLDAAPFKAAVIIDTDDNERSYQKVTYRDKEGKKHKRTKKFDRVLTFILTIGAPDDNKVEDAFEKFLSLIKYDIEIEDNNVKIKVLPGNWYDEKDKIIKAQAAIVFKIQFIGGVYVDTGYLNISTKIVAVEQEE